MTGRYKPYPKYRESGVEWLGGIPDHWIVRRLKHTSKLQSGIAKGQNLGEKDTISVPMLRVANVQDGYFDLADVHMIEIEPGSLARYSLTSGDVLMNEGGDNDKLGRGAVWGGKIQPCIHQNHVFAIRPKNIEPAWLQRVTESAYAKFHFYRVAKQSTNLASISSTNVKETPLLIPPQPERQKILAFLDHETARIDALIAKQQRMIELLKEKRQAVISHAVTQGLNPDAPMKDSGVEWLGEVPAHWSASKIRYVAKLESGHTPSRNKPEYWVDCDIPWISLSDVWQLRYGNQIYIHETKEQVSELGLANSSARLLPKGTVILSRTASVGFPGIMGRDMATTQDFANWICGEKLVPEYLYFVLLGMKHEFNRLMMGSTHKTIYMPDIQDLATPLPSRDEQHLIVAFLEKKLPQFDSLLDNAARAVDLYKERRTALISAAVTGKIDVRNWRPAHETEEIDLPMVAEPHPEYSASQEPA